MKEKLYFIPGLMCDERLWSRMAPYLENKYELIYLNIPHTLDFNEMSEIINEQIKEDNSKLVGFSLGGYTSLYFSLKYPNKISKLYLLAASGSVSSQKEINRRREMMIASREYDFCAPTIDKIKTLIDENSYDDKEMISIIQDMFLDLGRDTFEMQLQATFERENLLEKVINNDKPLHIIYGDKDRLVDDNWIKLLEEKRDKNISFTCIETTSHNIPLDFPKEISEILLKD